MRGKVSVSMNVVAWATGSVWCLALTSTAVVLRAVRSVNRPADVSWCDGHEIGYGKGWLDGRRSATMRVVHLPASREGGRAHAVD